MYLIALLLAHLLMLYLISTSAISFVLRRIDARRQKVQRADWRVRYYLKEMGVRVLLIGVLTIIAIGLGWSPQTIGLRVPTNILLTILFVASMCLFTGLMIFFARRLLRDPDPTLQAQIQEHSSSTLPNTPKERFFFALYALTIPISEELLFRGFMLVYLTSLFPQIPLWPAVILSACIFALGHLSRGRSGVATAGIFGLIYGFFYILTGSLFPLMIVHCLFDLRILVTGTKGVAAPQSAQQNAKASPVLAQSMPPLNT